MSDRLEELRRICDDAPDDVVIAVSEKNEQAQQPVDIDQEDDGVPFDAAPESTQADDDAGDRPDDVDDRGHDDVHNAPDVLRPVFEAVSAADGTLAKFLALKEHAEKLAAPIFHRLEGYDR